MNPISTQIPFHSETIFFLSIPYAVCFVCDGEGSVCFVLMSTLLIFSSLDAKHTHTYTLTKQLIDYYYEVECIPFYAIYFIDY